MSAEDTGSISGSGRSRGVGNGNPLQYFFFYISILTWKIPRTEEAGGLQSTGVTNSRTRLSTCHTHTHI